MARAPVYLNVYDMFWLNDYASTIGVGVFHSGIEVYGTEYAYGGHPFPFSGIFENAPRDAEELGDNFRFKESICLGQTDFSPEDVRRMIQQLGLEYRGDRYHLITKNCNHFSNHLSKTLTGQELPSWINRLANISGSLPFLERWIPQEWLTPIALQQSLDREARQSHRNGMPATIAPPHNANAVTNRAGMNTAAIRVDNNSSREAAANNGEENGRQQQIADDKSTSSTTSTTTATGKNGSTTKLTQSWRLFQRRNGGGGGNTDSTQSDSSISAPVTARQPPTMAGAESSMSPTLSRLWSSIKGNVASSSSSSNSNGGTTSSSSTSSTSTTTMAKNNNNN